MPLAGVRPILVSPAMPQLHLTRLLKQLRERVRRLCYSRRTGDAHVHRVRACVRFHGIRHPVETVALGVESFLAWLPDGRWISASSNSHALAALLFLRAKVLGVQLP